jgi:hypothetical protein
MARFSPQPFGPGPQECEQALDIQKNPAGATASKAAREAVGADFLSRLRNAHLVFLGLAVMRWLIIALLVSLVALLVAAAGMARHIFVHRAELRRKQPSGTTSVVRAHEETDLESEV